MNLRQTDRTGRSPVWMTFGLLAWLATAAACTDGSVDPGTRPGTLTATLTSPNGPEGAALIEMAGPVSSVGTDGGQLFTAEDGGTTRVLVVLDEAGVIRFDLTLPDIRIQQEYTVLEVSGPDNTLRSDLSGYTLEFTP